MFWDFSFLRVMYSKSYKLIFEISITKGQGWQNSLPEDPVILLVRVLGNRVAQVLYVLRLQSYLSQVTWDWCKQHLKVFMKMSLKQTFESTGLRFLHSFPGDS